MQVDFKEKLSIPVVRIPLRFSMRTRESAANKLSYANELHINIVNRGLLPGELMLTSDHCSDIVEDRLSAPIALAIKQRTAHRTLKLEAH